MLLARDAATAGDAATALPQELARLHSVSWGGRSQLHEAVMMQHVTGAELPCILQGMYVILDNQLNLDTTAVTEPNVWSAAVRAPSLAAHELPMLPSQLHTTSGLLPACPPQVHLWCAGFIVSHCSSM